MNRAERRQEVKDKRAAKWRNLAKSFRALAGNELLSVPDRAALRDAAMRLDRGDRPLVVVASISAVLNRVDKLAAPGGAE